VPGARFVGLAWMIGGVVMFLVGGSRALSGWGSRGWPHVQGTVIRSNILPVPDGKPSGKPAFYKADIAYEYSPLFHDGYTHVFQNTRISYRGFVDPADDSYSQGGVRLLTRCYPGGKPVQVYYNPGKPDEAVLRPGEDFGTFSGSLIGLVFVFLGTLLLLFAHVLADKLMSFFRTVF
ncbi:MAG: DUF3592 domain-containing protein, partial [Armatimonadetes bacterium]|nr:DUF3592 domain-containing protein [Armatimonadota bacterium]